MPIPDLAEELLEKFNLAARQPDLDDNQQMLLEKIIMLDGIKLDGENDEIKAQLYELFFDWTSK